MSQFPSSASARVLRLAGMLTLVVALIGALVLADVGAARAHDGGWGDGGDWHDWPDYPDPDGDDGGGDDGGGDDGGGDGIEDYARYEPQTTCSPRPKVGTVALSRWMVRTFGGRAGGISRACGPGTSEHKEGRAFDWMVSVRKRADRKRVQRFFTAVLATDAAGRAHARARRMGIMYIIWNDRIWSASRGFEPRPYLNSSCRTIRRCSPSLRHRNHVHVSINRAAARGETSWYAGRL